MTRVVPQVARNVVQQDVNLVGDAVAGSVVSSAQARGGNPVAVLSRRDGAPR